MSDNFADAIIQCLVVARIHPDLTYESVQTSGGETEKFFQGVARNLHATTREVRRWVRLNYAKQSHVPKVKRPVLNKTRERNRNLAKTLAPRFAGLYTGSIKRFSQS